MSGWTGFNTAVSGLLASQRNLYTTNHNISNSSTEGYTRQKTVQEARTPFQLPGIGFLGSGTDISEINRVRDSYIDHKLWGENGAMGEWSIKTKTLTEIENIFNEPSDSSIRKNLDEFFTSLESLSTNPSDYSNRSLVRERAISLSRYLNETANKLYSSQKELNFQVNTKIKQINDLSERIKGLNEEIFKVEVDGSHANDLRDRRDLLVDELSKVVNVNTTESNGKFRVYIDGITLVDHNNASKIKYPPNLKENPLNPKEKLSMLEWENGNKVKLKSGELKSLMELRDGTGKGNDYRGIPFYIKRLNDFAKKFALKMNEEHAKGWGLDGSTDTFMFTIDGRDTSEFADLTSLVDKVKADNITLSGDINKDLDKIAASSEDLNVSDGIENNNIIKNLINLRDDKNFFDSTIPQGTPDDYMKSVLSTLAVDGQQAQRMTTNQEAIIQNVEKRRESVSGVSIDEEMSNMVKFQHTYNAAARMITTIDEVYDVTINRLGLVGR